MTKKEDGANGLVEMTFKEMFDKEVLPSGQPFTLMPDTVEIAWKVAEISDTV